MIELEPNFAQGYARDRTGADVCRPAGRGAEVRSRSRRVSTPIYASIVLHFLAQANFSLGQYETAAQQLVERIARTPGTDASRMLLAACYGHLGRVDDARAAWAELLKVNPNFSLAQRERVLPYKNPDDFQRIVDGLAKAGLP